MGRATGFVVELCIQMVPGSLPATAAGLRKTPVSTPTVTSCLCRQYIACWPNSMIQYKAAPYSLMREEVSSQLCWCGWCNFPKGADVGEKEADFCIQTLSRISFWTNSFTHVYSPQPPAAILMFWNANAVLRKRTHKTFPSHEIDFVITPYTRGQSLERALHTLGSLVSVTLASSIFEAQDRDSQHTQSHKEIDREADKRVVKRND